MKDNFSTQANEYAKFRPGYPPELFSYIAGLAPSLHAAWDCATGNGQAAVLLADIFTSVFATDISQKQLDNATPKPNISYSVAPAEKTPFPDSYFDCVVVAQALHWFNFPLFYAELDRVLKPGGVFAAIGYSLPSIDAGTDELLLHFYKNVIGMYWDMERRYVENEYSNVPFPYPLIQSPEFTISYRWNVLQFKGYLHSWSAVQHYIKANKHDPVLLIEDAIRTEWHTDEEKEVTFPIFVKIGKKVG